nr:hypothetical protein [uncultured Pseudomonas sp.]
MRVVIVASGPSAQGFVPPPGVVVIAVNGAIEWLVRADYWFTLDPSPINLERMHRPRHGVTYCAALNEPAPLWVRRFVRVAARGQEPEPGTPEWWLWRWSAVKTLSTEHGCIHTGNSAWGALGLAYHLGAERVALVGVDASADERIEGGRCRDLSHLPLLFESALPQIELLNCGAMRSRVPKMTIKEGMEWLTN